MWCYMDMVLGVVIDVQHGGVRCMVLHGHGVRCVV